MGENTHDALQFAVLDVETTGVHPGRADRVIEVAVVRVAMDGSVLQEFCSLVNPERDVGPTHIHGIRAGDVAEAPTFGEIAGDVLALLAGAVFVAHNAPFDERFVRAEMEHVGLELPWFPRLCTMEAARRADPAVVSRRLSCLCAQFGVEHGSRHSARDDARATAGLLAACLSRVADASMLGLTEMPLPRASWPKAAPSGRAVTRSEAALRRRQTPSYVAQLVARLPMNRESDAAKLAYEALLDRVLEDRRISPAESDELEQLAQETGLTQPEAVAVNEAYLLELLRLAHSDGIVSDAERRELQDVQRLLAIDDSVREQLEARARAGGGDRAPQEREDLSGKTVCFTGAMQCRVRGERADRSLAQELATHAGMIVRSGVSKKLDMLVLADPDSMSGKAKKARTLGVRLVAESVFWRMVGITPE